MLNDKQMAELLGYLQTAHSNKVRYDKQQMLKLGFSRFGLPFFNHEDLTSVFCSEFVASALKHIALISQDTNCSMQTPGDVARYPIYRSEKPTPLKSTVDLLLKKEDYYDYTTAPQEDHDL